MRGSHGHLRGWDRSPGRSPAMLGESLMGKANVESSGVMNMTVGSTDPGPVFPGSMYEVSFDAVPGDPSTQSIIRVTITAN